MDDLSSIWMIHGPNGPDMVQMGPDGSDMARTGRNSSSNILTVMKRHVKTFALRDFHIFSDLLLFQKGEFIFFHELDFFNIFFDKYPQISSNIPSNILKNCLK